MKIQGIVSDVRQQIEVAGRNYQGAFKAYIDAQRKALAVVTSGGTSLANTEIGAAKNIFASARASFERARKDGVRKLASEPKSYAPKSRAQLISAYKSTIDQLVKTGSELNEVVTTGYRNVLGQLTGATEKQVEEPAEKQAEPAATGRKTASRRSAAAKPAASKKAAASKTAKTGTASKSTATRKTSKTTTSKSTKASAEGRKTAKKAATASNSAGTRKKSAAPRKRAASQKTSASTANNSTTS